MKILLLILLLLPAAPLQAWEPSFSYGWGQAESETFDFRLTHYFEPWVERESYTITPLANIGGTVWQHDGRNEEVWGAVAALGLDLSFKLSDTFQPYVALTAGPSYISEDVFMDRQLGGRFIFNTELAFGAHFGPELKHRFAVDLMHYSNGYTYYHNDGFNSLALSYGYNF